MVEFFPSYIESLRNTIIAYKVAVENISNQNLNDDDKDKKEKYIKRLEQAYKEVNEIYNRGKAAYDSICRIDRFKYPTQMRPLYEDKIQQQGVKRFIESKQQEYNIIDILRKYEQNTIRNLKNLQKVWNDKVSRRLVYQPFNDLAQSHLIHDCRDFISETQNQKKKDSQNNENNNAVKNPVVTEKSIENNSEQLKNDKIEDVTKSHEQNNELAKEENKPKKHEYDVTSEEDFEDLLRNYAEYNAKYYDGHKRTPEEVAERRKMNDRMKRFLKAKEYYNESVKGEMTATEFVDKEFTDDDIKEIAEDKDATMTLYSVMARGVYNERRLTQKQRQALANVMQRVSDKRLDMDQNLVKMETMDQE